MHNASESCVTLAQLAITYTLTVDDFTKTRRYKASAENNPIFDVKARYNCLTIC